MIICHEYMYLTQSANGAAPDLQIDFTHVRVVHLGRLKAPREAAGQMDLMLTCSQSLLTMAQT
jgi:hypothetical protein